MTSTYAPPPDVLEPVPAPTTLAPKQPHRLAETALGSITAPSEETMLRAIAERMLDHFSEMCGVRAWTLVRDPFEADHPRRTHD